MQTSTELMSDAESGIRFASKLPPKISYSIKDDAVPITGSISTAYRRLNQLENLGLATVYRSKFQINRAARQPMDILEKLVPSLIALKNARRFGRRYHISDINFVKNNLPDGSFVTLDYRAWDITKFQTPLNLYIYVTDIEKAVKFLKDNDFGEGTKGHIILLQKQSDIKNDIQQVYLDCIAKGGRNILDAIAIEIMYGDKINVKGRFNIDDILKVQSDMQTLQ